MAVILRFCHVVSCALARRDVRLCPAETSDSGGGVQRVRAWHRDNAVGPTSIPIKDSFSSSTAKSARDTMLTGQRLAKLYRQNIPLFIYLMADGVYNTEQRWLYIISSLFTGG